VSVRKVIAAGADRHYRPPTNHEVGPLSAWAAKILGGEVSWTRLPISAWNAAGVKTALPWLSYLRTKDLPVVCPESSAV
jgi:hypothetical protein